MSQFLGKTVNNEYGISAATFDQFVNTSITTTTLASSTLAVSGASALHAVSVTDLTFPSTNISIGASSGDLITTGTMNLSWGQYAGQKITSGSSNIALGDHSQVENQVNNGNVSVGTNTLRNNLGSGNTCIGYNSESANTSGSNSVVVGASSCNSAGNLNRVVCIGSNSLTTSADLSNTVVIGCQVDPSGVQSNACYVGNTSCTLTVLQGDVQCGGGITLGDYDDLRFTAQSGTLSDVLNTKASTSDVSDAVNGLVSLTALTEPDLGGIPIVVASVNGVAPEDWALSADVVDALAYKADVSALTSLSGDVSTLSGTVGTLSTTVADAVTSAELTTALADYALSADVVTALTEKAAIADLTALSGDVSALEGDVSSLASTVADAVTSTALSLTLADYALTSDLTTGLATKQDAIGTGDLAVSDVSGLQSNLDDKLNATWITDGIVPGLSYLNIAVGTVNGVAPSSWVTSSALSSALGALAVADIDGLTTALGDKADDADLTTLSGTVTTLSGTVTTLSTTVSGKADSSDVCLLTGAQTVGGAKVFSSPVTTQSVYELFHSITSGTNAFTLDVSVGNVFYLSTGTTTSANFTVQLNNCPTASTQSMNVTLIYATAGKWFCNSISCYSDAGSTAITLASATPLYNGGTPAPSTSTVLAQTFCLVRLFASNYVLSSLSSFY